MECVYLAYDGGDEREPCQAFVGPEGLALNPQDFFRALGAPEPVNNDYTEQWRWRLAHGLTGYGFENAYTEWVLGHPGVCAVTIECLS